MGHRSNYVLLSACGSFLKRIVLSPFPVFESLTLLCSIVTELGRPPCAVAPVRTQESLESISLKLYMSLVLSPGLLSRTGMYSLSVPWLISTLHDPAERPVWVK